MRFVTRSDIAPRLEGRTVAIVGSGPGCLDNPRGFIDSHDVVVRVNNYRLLVNRDGTGTGQRTDIHYSFYGTSIRKTAIELRRDGVSLCMCKCPDAHAIQSDWHQRHDRMIGVDYRPHYARRRDFWFCDTYIPSVAEFLEGFNMLGGHVPTTGFAAIIAILSFDPKSVYLTGFDFFRSRIHNVTERWRSGAPDDPIRHLPERELLWLAEHRDVYPLTFDPTLNAALKQDAQ